MSPNEQTDPLTTIKRPKALTVKVGAVSDKAKREAVLWPRTGAIRLPIYPMGDGRWCIVYRLAKGGPRQRILRKTLAEAKACVVELCTKIENGETAAGALSPQQRIEAAAAARTLNPLGIALDANARDVAAAHKLTGGASVMEMARFWARHHGAATSRKTAVEVHQELLASKAPLGLSRVYRRQLENDLGRFVTAFKDSTLAEIGVAEIEKYLLGCGVGWYRYNNLLSLIITLFLYGKSRSYLPQDRDTAPERVAPLSKPRNTPPPRVFTPAELRIALDHVQPDWKPWLVLGAFAGLRMAEIGRLEWEDILFDDALIHITEKVAKRTTRKIGDVRYVPMTENLLAWLRPWKGKTGRVTPHERSDNEEQRLAKFLPGGRWGKNPLRHSWISYRSAQTSNLPLVADEAGNSTEISRTAYRNPRMKREASAWFDIFPPEVAPENLVEFRAVQ